MSDSAYQAIVKNNQKFIYETTHKFNINAELIVQVMTLLSNRIKSERRNKRFSNIEILVHLLTGVV